MSKPWYHAGLQFGCTQCGQCCTGAPGYVWVDDDEIAELAAAVGVDVEAFHRRYVRRVGMRRSLIEYSNGDCVFYRGETKSCEVYEHRPRQCRTFPFWDSTLASPAAWQAMCERRPGGNQGPLVSPEEIERRREKRPPSVVR